MTPKVTQFLNRTILVSIPALFEDGVCRPYKLAGVEINGLWLQSEDLNQRLLTEDTQPFTQTAPVAFVPFAQIAAVMAPTQTPEGLAAAFSKKRQEKSSGGRHEAKSPKSGR